MKLLYSTIFFLVLSLTIQGQTNKIFNEIQEHKLAEKSHKVDNLATQIKAYGISGTLKNGNDAISFIPNDSEIKELLKKKVNYLEFSLPDPNGNLMNIELVKANIFSDDFRVVVDDLESQDVWLYDKSSSVHYRGIVNGDAKSLVSFSFYDNSLMGLIHSPVLGELNIGKLNDTKSNTHIVYEIRNLNQDNPFSCATEDDGQGYTKEQLEFSHTKAAGDIVDIFIEVDGDLTNAKGGVASVTNYITGLFNQSATLYAIESINMVISEIEVNTSIEYRGGSSSRLLSNFQKKKRNGFNGDLGHLVNNKPNLGGVAAGFSGICNSDVRQSLCYSGISTTYEDLFEYSWSVMVFTHEMGHLLGSRHTHACVWNGDNTAIDGCAGGTEGTCPLPDNPSSTEGGTIMSYCHITSSGINFNNGFGDQPGNVIRNTIDLASCLSTGTGPTCEDGIQNGDEEGVDCGGSCPNTCPPPPIPTCTDGIQNGDEEGVDCGGSCDPCTTPACEDPTNLSVTNMRNKGGKRADLNWASVSGALSYNVRIRVDGSSTWNTTTTAETSARFRGFTEGETYEWQVQAVCGSTSSNYVGCTFTFVDGGSDDCVTGLNAGLVPVDKAEEIVAFPNPANTSFSLEIKNPSNEIYNLTIYNSLGMSVGNYKISGNSPFIEINSSFMGEGFYYLIVESGINKKVKKLIISR